MQDKDQHGTLEEAIESLKMELDQLKAPYEKALSYRVYEEVIGRIKSRLNIFSLIGGVVLGIGGVVLSALSFLGLEKYHDMVEIYNNAKAEVEKTKKDFEATKDSIKTQAEDAGKDIKKETDSARQNLEKNTEDTIKEFKSKIEEIANKRIQEDVGRTIRNKGSDIEKIIRTEVIEAVKRTALSKGDIDSYIASTAVSNKQQGGIDNNNWVFYGSTSEDGGWRSQTFNSDKVPEKGLIVKAATDINIRSDHAIYSKNGWKFPSVKSILKYNESIIIGDVKKIKADDGAYYWVRFDGKR